MGRKIPEVLTDEEQEKLINVFNRRYFNSYRNSIIIKLFLNSGIRVSEMQNLKWKDINLQTGQLKIVQGKGKKDRIIWINEDMLNELRNWRKKQFEKLGECENIFTTRNKKAINSRDIREMVINYSQKAKINKHVTPKSLRHTYATDLLRQTKNIRLVQKALGHEDISTTMIYTHIVDDELESALKGFKCNINK